MHRLKHLSLSAAVLLLSISLAAQQTVRQFGDTEYLLYLPKGYKPKASKQWPLVVFLHGSGQSGTDIEKVKHHGLPMLIAQGKKFPFIVVSPQNKTRSWNTDALTALVKDVTQRYNVDEDRVYLTGLSMGGYGTWSLAIAAPQLFAAIAPVCGGGNPSKVWRLKQVPVWCFHGAKDNTVPISASQRMIDALKPVNADVKFTVYPEVGHDSWVPAYANGQLYTWLLSHKRYKHQQVVVSESALKACEGRFAGPDGIIRMVVDSGSLKAILPNGSIGLKPASETMFFISPDIFDYMEFEKNADGRMQRLVMVGDKKEIYRRVNR